MGSAGNPGFDIQNYFKTGNPTNLVPPAPTQPPFNPFNPGNFPPATSYQTPTSGSFAFPMYQNNPYMNMNYSQEQTSRPHTSPSPYSHQGPWLKATAGVTLKMATMTGNGRKSNENTVCVTGATGFMASWLVKRLLDKGYTVHATVRDPGNEAKVRPLLDISGAAERLKLFKADLSEDGSFDAAVTGCQGVFHVATPIDFAPKDPENDVIKPAINGTLNVLKSCTKAQTVKRVVVTSSAATVSINESAEQNQHMDESCWTDLDFLQTKKPPTWSYAVSKTLAEQAALQYGKEQGLDVVTIIPVLLAGPSILPNLPSSVHLALSLLTGNPHLLQAIKGMQLLSGSVSMVHVDDVCSAQIFLMDNPSAEGRYICCPINTSVPQLAHYLSKRYPQYNVPTEFEGVPQTQKLNLSSKKLVDSGFSFKFGIDEIYDDAVESAKAKGVLA